MVIYKTDDATLQWIDPSTVRIHGAYNLDAEDVEMALAELRQTPGGSLNPVIVLDGVCQSGNDSLMAYRIAGVKSVLAVIVKRATKGSGDDAEPEKYIGFPMPERVEDEDGDDDEDEG